MRDYLQEPRRRGLRFGEAVSYILAAVAAAGAAFGLWVATTAGSASNRVNNPFADLDVAFGWGILIIMTLLALLLVAVGRFFGRR